MTWLRATWSSFLVPSTQCLCGCLIRSAGNGRPSSCPGPLSLLLQTFICGGEKDADDFRAAEAVAVFPLELMPCELLSHGKPSCPLQGLPSGSSFCCRMFYCPHGILGMGTRCLSVYGQEHLGLNPLPFFREVSRSVFLFSLCICEM